MNKWKNVCRLNTNCTICKIISDNIVWIGFSRRVHTRKVLQLAFVTYFWIGALAFTLYICENHRMWQQTHKDPSFIRQNRLGAGQTTRYLNNHKAAVCCTHCAHQLAATFQTSEGSWMELWLQLTLAWRSNNVTAKLSRRWTNTSQNAQGYGSLFGVTRCDFRCGWLSHVNWTAPRLVWNKDHLPKEIFEWNERCWFVFRPAQKV